MGTADSRLEAELMSNPFSDAPAPRLSIAHLLLLTFTTAVSIALMNLLAQRWDAMIAAGNAPEVYEPLRVSVRIWRAGLLGMELALSAIVLHWIATGRPHTLAPGHRVLLILGAEAAVGLLLNGLFVLQWNSGAPPALSTWLNLLRFVLSLSLVAAWFAGFLATARTPWGWYFLFESILSLLLSAAWLLAINGSFSLSVLSIFRWLTQVGSLGRIGTALLALTLAIVQRRRHPHDWLHSLGIALLVARMISAILSRFVPMA
jgi:hypothetical protein